MQWALIFTSIAATCFSWASQGSYISQPAALKRLGFLHLCYTCPAFWKRWAGYVWIHLWIRCILGVVVLLLACKLIYFVCSLKQTKKNMCRALTGWNWVTRPVSVGKQFLLSEQQKVFHEKQNQGIMIVLTSGCTMWNFFVILQKLASNLCKILRVQVYLLNLKSSLQLKIMAVVYIPT